MSNRKKTITINNIDEVIGLQHDVEAMNCNFKDPIIEAVNTLSQFRETIEFKPQEAARLLEVLGIDEMQTPEEMNRNIHNSDKAFVMRKKFFISTISKVKIESLLISVVSEMSGLVNGAVLMAIVSLIKNMVLICLNENVQTEYKELCFRFFTRDEVDDIIILVINIDYNENSKHFSAFGKFIDFIFSRAKISFFGAIVKTSWNLIRDETASSTSSVPFIPVVLK